MHQRQKCDVVFLTAFVTDLPKVETELFLDYFIILKIFTRSSLELSPIAKYCGWLLVAPSRRGDLEILGYCCLQWLCSQLPWETCLSNLDKVAGLKNQ